MVRRGSLQAERVGDARADDADVLAGRGVLGDVRRARTAGAHSRSTSRRGRRRCGRRSGATADRRHPRAPPRRAPAPGAAADRFAPLRAARCRRTRHRSGRPSRGSRPSASPCVRAREDRRRRAGRSASGRPALRGSRRSPFRAGARNRRATAHRAAGSAMPTIAIGSSAAIGTIGTCASASGRPSRKAGQSLERRIVPHQRRRQPAARVLLDRRDDRRRRERGQAVAVEARLRLDRIGGDFQSLGEQSTQPGGQFRHDRS